MFRRLRTIGVGIVAVSSCLGALMAGTAASADEAASVTVLTAVVHHADGSTADGARVTALLDPVAGLGDCRP